MALCQRKSAGCLKVNLTRFMPHFPLKSLLVIVPKINVNRVRVFAIFCIFLAVNRVYTQINKTNREEQAFLPVLMRY